MQSTNDEIRLVVRSHRVPIEITEERVPKASLLTIGYEQKTIVRYSNVLDDGQQKVLEAAEELARQSGMHLVVRDLARENPIKRLFDRLTGRNLKAPALLIPPNLPVNSGSLTLGNGFSLDVCCNYR